MKRLITLILSAVIFIASLTAYICVWSSAAETPYFGKDYAVIRVFDKDGFTLGEISTIRFAAEAASTADVDDKGRLWCDAYSYFTDIYVTNGKGKGVGCKAVVTGGDFFLFHQLEFKSGWYYTDTDLHLDRVVIDEKLAFELYGSNYVEDMRITLGSREYYVAGVVALDESRAKELQHGDKPLIYIPDRIAEEHIGEMPYDSYEIMMQDPVSSYAVNALASATEGKETVDVTSRFDITRIFKLLREFPTRSYRTEAEVYPYWENTQRGTEDILALLLTVNAVTFLGLAINVVIFIIERKKQ